MNETFYLFLSRKEQQQVLQNLEQRGFLWESGKKPTDFPAVQNIILVFHASTILTMLSELRKESFIHEKQKGNKSDGNIH